MTLICAHRGASGQAPENTLAALQLGWSQGAEMAEIDVQLSADGVPVLMHDLTVDRTTNGSGSVNSLALSGLEKLDAGSWFGPDFAGEKTPTLEAVLAVMPPQTGLNIELKGEGGPELEEAVVRVIRELDKAEQCLLTSFDHLRIDGMVAQGHGLSLGYIIGQGCWKDDYLESSVSILSLEKSLVTPDRLVQAHARGKEVHVWTVNDEKEMSRLLDLGVDVIITNEPEQLRMLRCSR